MADLMNDQGTFVRTEDAWYDEQLRAAGYRPLTKDEHVPPQASEVVALAEALDADVTPGHVLRYRTDPRVPGFSVRSGNVSLPKRD